MRNVSSHSLDAESPETDPLPEPLRVDGDIIRFNRQAARSLQMKFCSSTDLQGIAKLMLVSDTCHQLKEASAQECALQGRDDCWQASNDTYAQRQHLCTGASPSAIRSHHCRNLSSCGAMVQAGLECARWHTIGARPFIRCPTRAMRHDHGPQWLRQEFPLPCAGWPLASSGEYPCILASGWLNRDRCRGHSELHCRSSGSLRHRCILSTLWSSQESTG